MATDHDPLMQLDDDPVDNTVHHPYSAFNQGWDAAEQGIPWSLNPYEDGTREADWWELGYEEQQDSQ